MWRRACLRSHDDTVTLTLVWCAAVLDVLLATAAGRGWATGLAAATLWGGAWQALFRWRRRRWDRLVVREMATAEAEVAVLLRRPS